MRFLMAAVLSLVLSSAFAQQQQPDPAMMRRIIPVLQQQRNAAFADVSDRLALAEAKAAQLAEEVEQLKAQLAKTKEDKHD
jgi:hypothetical protein